MQINELTNLTYEEKAMKTQNLKNWRNVMVSVTVLLTVLFPMVGKAGSMGEAGSTVGKKCVHISTRPLSDFLEAQGTTSSFFEPVQDMLGWDDGIIPLGNFGMVDYAGLANAYILEETGASLGTGMSGRVLECERTDGKVMISVVLNTRKALGFAQSIPDIFANNFDFLNTPTIFGAKAQDVVAGAEPALGPAHLRTTFVINKGDSLPDIRTAFQDNTPDVRPFTYDFKSTTVGTLPDGTRACLCIEEGGGAVEDGELIYTKEIVDIVPADKKNGQLQCCDSDD